MSRSATQPPPDVFALLRAAVDVAEAFANGILATVHGDPPRTPDDGDGLAEKSRQLATTVERRLRRALLLPMDPADLHAISAAISALARRAARAHHLASLLGPKGGDTALRELADVLRETVLSAAAAVNGLSSPQARARRHVHDARAGRMASRHLVHEIAKRPQGGEREILLTRSVAESFDAVTNQSLALVELVSRVAGKYD